MQIVQQTYFPKMSVQAPGAQFGAQTANHANSAAPSTATLSNTAAGYTTLGGKFRFNAISGAATDYALFAYQVPSTHRLVVDSVYISSYNTGAAVATTATIFEWAIGINSTAVSLATTDSGETFGPRVVPIGTQGFIIGAAIGQSANEINRMFRQPLMVEPSRYLHVILNIPTGTNTASNVYRGHVTINGYFEPVGSILSGF